MHEHADRDRTEPPSVVAHLDRDLGEAPRQPSVTIALIPRPCRGCGVGEAQSHIDDCPSVIEAVLALQHGPESA